MPESFDRNVVRLEVQANEDVVTVRQRTRDLAQRAGFSLTEVTKIVTAASELARNTLEHGGGGYAELQVSTEGKRVGFRMTFVDDGPGIEDIERALQDGYTSGSGLGLGLGGSKRLMGELTIDSRLGGGTRVTAARWR